MTATTIHRTPTELAIGIQENFATMTVDVAAEFIGEDCVIHEAPSLPFGGDWKGPQGFVDLMARIQETFVEFSSEPISMVTQGDTLAFAAILRGRTAKGSFEMPLVEYWTCREGKIREVYAMWQDTKRIGELV